MVVKVRFEGQEFFMKLYSNMLVSKFIEKLAGITGVSAE